MDKKLLSTEQQERFSWLDEFLDALEIAEGSMDLETLQPTSWKHFQPLIAREWLYWFWGIIEERKGKNISFEDLKPVFEPDLYREHLLFVLEDLKSAKWPLEKRLEVADFFYQVLSTHMPQGDLFGLNGTTKKHSKGEVKDIMSRPFKAGTPEIAREFGKLYNGAYNLGAALYLDFYMGKAIENWGPYELGDGKILVVKMMKNLKPLEIWPSLETVCDKAVLYAVYEDVEFSTDLIACHTQYTGDVINGLKKWRFEVDGRNVTDLDEVKKIGLNFAKVGSKQWTDLMNLSEPDLLDKAVWVRCFWFNTLCDLLGLDWRPTEGLLNAVKGKTLEQGWKTWNQPTEEQAFKEYWRKIWDPRIDFYPNG